ncbi:hypothetical protein ACKFKF_07980 [Phormidesmis sp. 146-12]
MTFRWKAFRLWTLIALGLIVVGLALMGIPGLLISTVWAILLNTILQRQAIPISNGNLWIMGIYLSVIVPVGLPLSYVLTSRLHGLQNLSAPFNRRTVQVILATIVWWLLWSSILTWLFFSF